MPSSKSSKDISSVKKQARGKYTTVTALDGGASFSDPSAPSTFSTMYVVTLLINQSHKAEYITNNNVPKLSWHHPCIFHPTPPA